MQPNRKAGASLVVGLALSSTMAWGAPQVPPSAPVTVVNTPSNPVPVTGSVTFGNTGDPLLVRNVENPARSRFQASGNCPMEDPIISCFINFTVPSGRLLVIETVSFEVFTPPGQRAVEDIFIAQDGVDGIFFYAVPLAGTFFGNDIQSGTSSTKLYADPGTTVKVRTTRNIGTGRASAFASISGHLVDCGTGPGCQAP